MFIYVYVSVCVSAHVRLCMFVSERVYEHVCVCVCEHALWAFVRVCVCV